jgi:hypothetical protein
MDRNQDVERHVKEIFLYPLHPPRILRQAESSFFDEAPMNLSKLWTVYCAVGTFAQNVPQSESASLTYGLC